VVVEGHQRRSHRLSTARAAGRRHRLARSDTGASRLSSRRGRRLQDILRHQRTTRRLRVRALRHDRQRLDPFEGLLERSIVVEGPTSPSTVALSANPNFDTTFNCGSLITSLVTPRFVADVVIATGETIVRKQQTVLGGYDESNYVTGRLWVRASDGERIPVSVVARRDVVEGDGDATSPTIGVAVPALRLRELRDLHRSRLLVAASLVLGPRRHLRDRAHPRRRRDGTLVVRDGQARPEAHDVQ
jgi:hypothetical protein